uniref:Innexin n=1 Tax=Rhabditophanes sp. KR3021 TaxID=114890 RepID=A0AC35UCE9_9BILA
MMLSLPVIIKDLSKLANDVIDDHVDRLNSAFTIWAIFFCIFATSTAVLGGPLECYHIATHIESWKEALTNYCYVSKTYTFPFLNDINGLFTNETAKQLKRFNENHFEFQELVEEAQGRSINYYQWIPYFLLLQAAFFYLPKAVWNFIADSLGFDIRTIIKESKRIKEILIPEEKKVAMEDLLVHIFNFYEYNADTRRFSKSSYKTSMMAMGQLMVKALYAINAIAQFYFMNLFIADENQLWGYEHMKRMYGEGLFIDCHYFPRNAMCNTDDLKTAAVNQKSIQCLLTMNMINEKVFLFMYFWIVLLIVTTMYNFFVTITRFVYPATKQGLVLNLLLKARINDNIKKHINEFTTQVIKQDGFVLLDLLQQNAGEEIAVQIIKNLWIKHPKQKDI